MKQKNKDSAKNLKKNMTNFYENVDTKVSLHSNKWLLNYNQD